MNLNQPQASISHSFTPHQRMVVDQQGEAPTESQIIQQKASQIAQAYAHLWQRWPDEMKSIGKSSLKQAGKYDQMIATDITEQIKAQSASKPLSCNQ